MPKKKKEQAVQKAVYIHGIQMTEEMNMELIDKLAKRVQVLPTAKDYWAMIRYANVTFGYTIPNLRLKMGLATYGKWAELLEVK